MRTSKISQDTKRIVNALSIPRRSSSRLSSQRYAHSADSISRHDTPKVEDDAGSDVSSLPSSIDDSAYDSEASSRPGKRKRSANGSTTTVSASNTRRSPRKAPKLEGDDVLKHKARRQPAKRVTGPNGALVVEPPPNWERVYEVTAAMRKRVLAPVDTMGCESLAEDTRSPRDQRLQTLIALMLSSQTKDTVTAVAMKNLQDNLPGGFCLESLLSVEPDDLNELITKVGFHNNKTKYIKATAVILRDQFNSDIPDTIDGLTSLPGVGPKMAYLCMSAAWGRDEGIGVDVHVHRITNLWGWHKTNTPEQTRAELEAWLPKDKWHDINHLLVGFGQTICAPVGRKCGECDLAKLKLCPSAVASSPVKKKVRKEIKIDPGDGGMIKAETVKVEQDELYIKVEADLQADGNALLMAPAVNGAPVVEDS